MEGSPQNTLNFEKVCATRQPCAQQGNPILCFEILFMLIKNNKNIKSIEMFENTFLYNAYMDDSTFF